MYVELITILVRAKDDITRACRRCQSTLYIVFNIAKVGGPHKIMQHTSPDQWDHIRGNINPADVLSRVCDAGKVPEIWFHAPPLPV